MPQAYHAVELSIEGSVIVSEIRVGKDESIESALKRFKRKCQNSGIMAEVRKREHYEKPSVRRKLKALEARKKSKKFK